MLLGYIVILIKGLRQANETLMIGNALTPLLSGGNKYSLFFFHAIASWSIFEKLPEYRNRLFLFILWRIFSGFSKWQLLQRYVMNLLIWANIPVFASRLALLAYPDNRAFSNCVCPDALCPCHFPCPAFEGGLEVTTPAVVVAEIQVVIEDARRNIKYERIVFNNYVIERHWKSSWYLLIPRCRISFLVYVYLKKTTLWLVNIALYR